MKTRYAKLFAASLLSTFATGALAYVTAVETQPATDVGHFSATLWGAITDVDPDNEARVYIEWGDGINSTANLVASTVADGVFSLPLYGLSCNTTYTFKVTATLLDDTTLEGDTLSFTTTAPATVTTGSATGVTSSSATLSGTISALEANTSAALYIDWGSSDLEHSVYLGTASSDTTLSTTVTGLSEAMTYFYRLRAVFDGGTVLGETKSLTVPGTVTWIGGAATDWLSAANWSPAIVPDSEEINAVVDNDSATDSTVVRTLETHTSIGALAINEGDKVTINGKSGSKGSTYSSISVATLSNSGTFEVFGGSATKSHGNSFALTIREAEDGMPFNTATGVLSFKSISNYRRSHNFVYLPSGARNDGLFTIESRTTQDGGHVTGQIYSPGSEVVYHNNGDTYLYGKGDGAAWVTLSSLLTNRLYKIDGTGTVHLASGTGTGDSNYRARSMVSALVPGVTFLNAAGHTIRGVGNIGHNGSNTSSSQSKMTCHNFAAITNSGLVRAECIYVDGTKNGVDNLVVCAGSGALINTATGVIVAGGEDFDRAVLDVMGTGTFESDGVVEIRANSTMNIATNIVTTFRGELRGAGEIIRMVAAEGDTPVAVTLDGVIRPGDSEHLDGTGANGVGTLNVGAPVILDSGAVLSIRIGMVETTVPSEDPEGEPTTETVLANDCLAVDGALTLGGSVTLEPESRVRAGRYVIATCTPGELTGDRPAAIVQNGNSFLLEADAEAGTLTLVVAPKETLLIIR